jgi:hypothetical protein
MAALILLRHRNNIRRLLAGTEPRLGERRAQSAIDNPGPPAGWTSRLGTEGGRR